MKALLDIPKVVVYSDVNPNVLEDSPFELVFNEDSVKRSLETIFTTPYSSRVFRRQFGSKVLDLLYEPVDNHTASHLKTMMREMATMWEPRISDVEVLVIPDIVNQRYYVDMRYSIPNLGSKMVNYKFNISK
jgi:phage baseplate assembly protein W